MKILLWSLKETYQSNNKNHICDIHWLTGMYVIIKGNLPIKQQESCMRHTLTHRHVCDLIAREQQWGKVGECDDVDWDCADLVVTGIQSLQRGNVEDHRRQWRKIVLLSNWVSKCQKSLTKRRRKIKTKVVSQSTQNVKLYRKVIKFVAINIYMRNQMKRM